jgi:hypothetical protein
MAKVDTKKCEITSREGSIKVRTARGILSYPWLFAPRDGKWSTSLLFPASADISALNEAVELAAKEFFGPDYLKKYPKLKRPILKTAESPRIGADPEAFPVFIRTSTRANDGRPSPEVVDHLMTPVEDSSEVYPGRWAMLSITVKGYDTDGNKGVTCYLNNVQLLEHGDKLAGASRSAADDFVAVDISDSADALFK